MREKGQDKVSEDKTCAEAPLTNSATLVKISEPKTADVSNVLTDEEKEVEFRNEPGRVEYDYITLGYRKKNRVDLYYKLRSDEHQLVLLDIPSDDLIIIIRNLPKIKI